MLWWDGAVRMRVALIALNAALLAGYSGGALRLGAALLAAAAAALLLNSWLLRRAPGGTLLARAPELPGSIYLGEGFEWTVEALEESLETGRSALRSEHPLWIPDRLLGQHVLVLGTTGTGKSRLLELLAVQAIARGDAVIVIDPKGDEGLLRRLSAGAGDRFRLFSLPHPERSVRYNPLGRFHELREVADRVAALLPSSGDALPFRNFGWEIIHTASKELYRKQPITFQSLKRAAIDQPVRPLSERPREHYLKMANALIPVLSKLSTPLLCPKEGGISWSEVDEKRQVVYFSLGSLLGSETSSAVAKTAILDLQSYVGARYAFSKGNGPIWLFVDELGDVLTAEFVSLLNKSRGAGLRIVACGQTAADLEAALGSRARAQQVLGNANTIVQFRAQSAPDADVFSEMSGERLIRTRSEAAAYEPALLGSGFKTVDDFRARFGETSTWREHALVPPWPVVQLPTFHFFARWDGRVFRGRVPLLK
ncbi:MAG: type IV secretion system DNA-binding domain-containing protein [Planctomycetaceae bacterium]|nr:type IV secretion system DNA-binding domain-containing protein [Planctomycetaceae bacterium]